MKRLYPLLLIVFMAFWGCEEVDETAPQVSILSPSTNSTVSDTVTIQVSASDNNVLEKVELYTSNGLIGTSTANDPVHSFDWDTDAAGDNGEYILYAIAYDEAGNSATSTTITLNVMNYITITFTSQCYEEMEFTFGGEDGVIPALSSLPVNVPKNNGTTNFHGNIYTCGENPIWDFDVEVGDEDSPYTLWTTNALFYLYLTNEMSVNVSYTTVNYGLSFYEETCYATLPNNGVKYGMGYYYAQYDSNIYLFLDNHPDYDYVYWNDIDFTWELNQTIDLTASGFMTNFGNDGIKLRKIVEGEHTPETSQGYSIGALEVPELPDGVILNRDR